MHYFWYLGCVVVAIAISVASVVAGNGGGVAAIVSVDGGVAIVGVGVTDIAVVVGGGLVLLWFFLLDFCILVLGWFVTMDWISGFALLKMIPFLTCS